MTIPMQDMAIYFNGERIGEMTGRITRDSEDDSPKPSLGPMRSEFTVNMKIDAADAERLWAVLQPRVSRRQQRAKLERHRRDLRRSLVRFVGKAGNSAMVAEARDCMPGSIREYYRSASVSIPRSLR